MGQLLLEKSEENKKIYTRAADIIRERGWVQGQYSTEDGVCLVGALTEAEIELHIHTMSAVLNIAAILIHKEGSDEGFDTTTKSITGWNDVDHRIEDEVIGLLKEAADMMEAEV